ncbi:MAG: glycine--tRNA ligase subunit beta, partial [Rickettsiales bacterium]|nr:glycine--tRNA ligase subunit beta [Rickettsiales bacterium]
RKKTLSEWAEGLKTVTYHAKLGTIADKVERIAKLAEPLASITNADFEAVQKACNLAKADLTTGMVGEFPELQGVMGRYYALDAKKDATDTTVADAIRDHYKPQGPSDSVPTEKTAICVALADKLDTLISMFVIGEKPTGSKDPFALRRAGLGNIRIIRKNDLSIPLADIIDPHVRRVIDATAKIQKSAPALTIATYRDKPVSTQTIEIIDFLRDRVKIQMKDEGIRHDVIEAICADGDDNLLRMMIKMEALQQFLNTNNGRDVLAMCTRVFGVLSAEEKKNKNEIYKPYTAEELIAKSFHTKEENEVKNELSSVPGRISNNIEDVIENRIGNYRQAMEVLVGLCEPVEQFFTNLMVNDPDTSIRETRLCLLATIRACTRRIADFSKIEGDTRTPTQKAA